MQVMDKLDERDTHVTPLAPTVDAIDAWLAQQAYQPDRGDGFRRTMSGTPIYGVNIWTKASACRCVTSKAEYTDGTSGYWTIASEGSSNGSREYAIPAAKIVRAEGWIV